MVSRVRTPLLVKGAIEPKNISFDLKQTLVASAYEQLKADNYSCFSFRGLDWIGWVGMVGWSSFGHRSSKGTIGANKCVIM